MMVKFTRSIPGGEKRGYVEGREFDWPMILIRKMRADYGDDILVMSGAVGAWIERTSARRAFKGQGKALRQERLRLAGVVVGVSDVHRQDELADVLASASGQVPQVDDDAPDVEDAAPQVLADVEPGTEAPVPRRRYRRRVVVHDSDDMRAPEPEIPVG